MVKLYFTDSTGQHWVAQETHDALAAELAAYKVEQHQNQLDLIEQRDALQQDLDGANASIADYGQTTRELKTRVQALEAAVVKFERDFKRYEKRKYNDAFVLRESLDALLLLVKPTQSSPAATSETNGEHGLKTTVGMLLTLEQYNLWQSQRNQEFWMNVYPDGHFVIWPTRAVAEEHHQTGRVALVHLRLENGQFVPYTFMPEYSQSEPDGAT